MPIDRGAVAAVASNTWLQINSCTAENTKPHAGGTTAHQGGSNIADAAMQDDRMETPQLRRQTVTDGTRAVSHVHGSASFNTVYS